MNEERPERPRHDPADNDLSRRAFVAMSIGSGLAAATGSAGAALPVVETNVEIKTPDGTCDAAFIHPATGSHPGVLIWPDAFGLRPSMREMGRRLAGEGYCGAGAQSLLPPRQGAVIEDRRRSTSRTRPTRAKLQPLMGVDQRAGRRREGCARPTSRSSTRSRRSIATKKIGTQGYCMGGALVMRTAAAVPDRIGAGASFHGGGLVTDRAEQPASAGAEDQGADVHRRRGQRRHAAARGEGHAARGVRGGQGAGRRSRSTRRRSTAGACPTCRSRPTAPIYSKADAERAWGKLLALYKVGARRSLSALVDDPFEQAKAHFFAALGRQQAGDFAEAERLYRPRSASSPGAPRR